MQFSANKFVVALGGAVSVLLSAVSENGSFDLTPQQWAASGLALLGALGVYQVSNQVKS